MCRRRCLTVLGLLAVGFLGSCREPKGAEAPPAGDKTPAVRKSFGTGPVKMHVELSSAALTTADALLCKLTLEIGDGFEAEFPDLLFPDDLPGMFCTDFKEEKRSEGGKRLIVRTFELEPEHAGQFKLPALEVYYHRANEVKEELLTSAPLELTVTETPVAAKEMELRPSRGLITVAQMEARQRRVWPWVLSGAAALAVLILLAVYLVRRPRRLPPPPPAHEIALEALRQLVAKKLIEQGLIEVFFVEITGIVRDYIEGAFGVKAPEQTTEEFLADIVGAPAVARHRQELEPFLRAADEVKFARAQPAPAVVQRTFDTARDFVVQSSGQNGGRR